MTWLTWRQHRVQAATTAGALTLLAIFLVVTERQMTSYLNTTGLAACLSQHDSCDSLSQLFENRYGTLLNDIAYLNFLPCSPGCSGAHPCSPASTSKAPTSWRGARRSAGAAG